jgi:hypothetical protein
VTTTVDPRIAILSDLSDPPFNEVTETRCVPWDDAVKMLAAYKAAVLRKAADEVFSLDFDQQVRDDEDLGSVREAWDLGTVHARDELRRLADEAEAGDG